MRIIIKHKIVLLDSGLVLCSGDEADAQIRSVQLTEQCNDQTDLCPGAACAACAEVELWAPHDVVQLQAGEEFALSRIDTDLGNEEPVGIFIAEQPTKASANVYRLDAYDRMIRLDQDFSPWLRDHQADFPMTIPDIVAAACEVCGQCRLSSAGVLFGRHHRAADHPVGGRGVLPVRPHDGGRPARVCVVCGPRL